MTTPVLSAFLNPVADTLTLYFPNFRSGTRYPPADDDTVLYSVPVSAPVIVIVALGTTAPVLSRIVPANVPRSDCPKTVSAETAIHVAIVSHFRIELSPRIFVSHPCDCVPVRPIPTHNCIIPGPGLDRKSVV